jgi:cell division inhibitor SepF
MGGLRNAMVYLGLAEEEAARSSSEEIRIEEAPTVTREEPAAPKRAEVTQIKRERPQRVVAEAPSGDLARISTIHPSAYNDAKTIGESFRDGIPVIMNLSDMEDAGLVFGLRGSIERVTNKVFLLSPAHVEVSAAVPASTPRPAAATGFFNQS